MVNYSWTERHEDVLLGQECAVMLGGTSAGWAYLEEICSLPAQRVLMRLKREAISACQTWHPKSGYIKL